MDPLMIIMAFAGGALSFLSPCILPLAPGYLGIISGISLGNLQAGRFSKRKVLKGTLAFILGFSIIFISLGIGSSFFGQMLRSNRIWLSRVSGLVVIILGLHQAGWLKIPFLYQERRVAFANASTGLLGAFLAGMAFALGWTPCVGPILGSILALAGSQADLGKGLLLLTVYSFGLGTPFLLLALAFQSVSHKLNRIKPYLQYLQWLSGILLVLMGILLLTGSLSMISGWLIRFFKGWTPEKFLQR